MSVKISDLPQVTTLKDADILPIVSADKTSKVTYGDIKTQINNDLALSDMQNNIGELQDDIGELQDDMKEVFQSVSDGKKIVASAITDKGVETPNDATFQTMADNISSIKNESSVDALKVTKSAFEFFEDEITVERVE